MVDGFKTKTIGEWAKRHLASGSLVISDGLACFRAVKEANCEHLGVVTGGDLDLLEHPAFNWVNTMIGNVKNSLPGSCHTLGEKHIPRHWRNIAFGVITVLTSRVCWLNWGMRQALRCHIDS